MMPIAELLRLDSTIDEDGRSPIADEVSARWGVPPGAATFWRSSATHVFRIDVADGAWFLRFAPAHIAEGLVSGAETMDRLAAAGAAVVAVVRNADGRVVEVVPTGLGQMAAMAVEAAPGQPLDADTISIDQAHGWGAALARLHHAGRSIDTRGQVEIADLTGSTDPTARGLLHGDFELDNVHWDDGAWTAFDLDGAAVGPYLLDVAAAVRDLLDDGQLPAGGRLGELLAAFLNGYASVRPEELARFEWLPQFVAADARARARGLEPIASEVLPADAPEWAVQLHHRVAAALAGERER